MEVDAVEQRPRQSAEITLPLSRRAHALLERRAASPARIGGGNELDARRKVADSSPAGDGCAFRSKMITRIGLVITRIGGHDHSSRAHGHRSEPWALRLCSRGVTVRLPAGHGPILAITAVRSR